MNHPYKKQALLEAAIELFAKDGFWQTTTASIAQEAGVATGTLFTYFPTKNYLIDELYLTIKHEALAELQREPKLHGSFEAVFRLFGFASFVFCFPQANCTRLWRIR